MKKTMSAKQIAANRCNATKSTGPRTAEGKNAARLNALKHGILSREVVVRGLHIRESSREFDAFWRGILEDLGPVGAVEEMLVDRIVTTHWRLRRVITVETGEIALNVDRGHRQRSEPMNAAARFLHDSLFGDPVPFWERHSSGLLLLQGLLDKARAAVEKDGGLTDAILRETEIGGKPNSLTKRLAEVNSAPVENPSGLDEVGLKAKRRERVVAWIDRKLGEYERMRREVEEWEGQEEAARQAAANLPSAETLDRILRYETTLERQLYRAMMQLERVQWRRQGESVPPPLTLEVSPRC